MAFVLPNLQNPHRAPGRRGYWRGLGQSVWCEGNIRTGGAYTRQGAALILTPDDNPGRTYRLVNAPGNTSVQEIVGARGDTGRLAVAGWLLNDGTVIVDGWGLMGPNESYLAQGGTSVTPQECPGYLGYASRPADVEAEAAPADDAPPPWEGAQVGTIVYDGGARTVTVYAADGRSYTVDKARTAKVVWDELAGPAPQGTRLVLTGRWDPESGTVVVTEWYIEELGEGAKKYGIREGELVPQSPDVPSTDWPGGLPPERRAAAANGAAPTTAAAAPLAAGLPWWVGAGILLALARRGRWI